MPEPVKIAYLQPNSEIGGSDICLLRMIQALEKDRFEPLVILPGDGPLVVSFRREGARVIFQPMMQLRTKLSPAYQARFTARYWPTVRALQRICEREQVRIVHTNSLYCLYGSWAARLAGRPHVWHIREIPPAVPLARPALGRFVRAFSARVVCMSRACEHSLFGPGAPPVHSRVLYEGISLSQFGSGIDGGRVRSALGVPVEAPLVGFVARLDPWKGLDVFLKAAAIVKARVPRARFLVAGDAPRGFETYARKMRELAASLGLAGSVHFAGFRHGVDDIPELMASLTVLSHTSVRPEPFGLVLIEAMAMSRPVVATAMGGPLEILAENETGLLTPPGDPEANAAAVCRILEDAALARRMGVAGRRRVEERFSVAGFRAHLTRIYDEVREVRAAAPGVRP